MTWLNKLRPVSFQRKLLGYSLMVSIVPVLLVGLLSSFLASRSLQNEVNGNHKYMLDQVEKQLSQFIASLRVSSINIATSLAVERTVRDGPSIDNLTNSLEMNETIRRIRSSSPIPYNVSMLLRNYGNYLYSNAFETSSRPMQRLAPILDTWKPKANEPFLVPANTFDDQPDMLLYSPVPIQSSYTQGVLVLHVNPQDILRFLGSLELANRTKLMVADEQGRIVISNQEEQMGKRLEDFKDLYANREKAVLQPVTIDLEGVPHRLRAKTAASGGWTYYVMTPAEVLSRQVNRIQWITWGLVGILTLAWGSVSLFASRWLYGPIDRLSRKVLPVRPEAPRPRDGLDALDSYLHELVDTNQTLLSRLKEQFPYLKQGFFHQLLKGELSESDFLAAAERFHFRPAGGAVYVCVAQTDRVDLFRETYRGKDRGLIHYALLKMLEETFHAFPSCLAFTPETGQVVLLIGTEDDHAGRQESGEGEMLERLIRCSDEARGHALTYFRFPLSIAISSRLEGYEAIARGYEEARGLLRHRLALGENATIAAGRLDPGLNRSTQQLVELQKRIVFHLVHGNAEESRRLLAGLREELTATPVSPDTARALFAYLLGELDYTLQQSGCDLRDRFGLDPYGPLYRLQSVNELEQWLSDEMIPAVQEALSEQTVSRQKKMVHQVKAFIEERCEEDLSLQMAADHFDLSVSHLSKIFKEEAGVTFSEYVLEWRMSKAREWLEHTEMPIKEIAARLSYASVQTFNRIFKQTCGMPPGEYRKQKRAAS